MASVVDGILSAIPALMETVPKLVGNFLSALTERGPQIVTGGFESTKSLISGILDGLPDLISGVGELIVNFVSTVSDHIPDILGAGVEIIKGLIEGIIDTIPTLVSNIPKVIVATVEALGKIIPKVLEVGKNIVSGIWDGIQSMISWLKNKVSDFLGGIVDGVKDVLGIHSPSTVFAGIGDNMVQGIAVGWSKEIGTVERSIKNSLSELPQAVSTPLKTSISTKNIQPQTASSVSYYNSFAPSVSVPTPSVEASGYSGRDDDVSNGDIINIMLACTEKMIAAIKEQGGDIYLDATKVGKKITEAQNRANRMHGRTLQNV